MKGLLADTRPLRHAHFRRLFTAHVITMVGAQLTVVAVPAQIYADTGSSAYVGLTGLFGLVPLIVFGLWGGALADHFDRRRILQVSTTGLIVSSALFWLQALLGNTDPWLLLVLFAVQQAFFAVVSPTRSAVLPRLLPDDLLPAANALMMTVMQAGAIAGPLLAGVLLPLTGFAWLYGLDALCLLATLWAVTGFPSLPVEGASGTPGLRSVVDGFRYLATQPVLLMSFVVDLIAMVFGMPRALFPQLAHEAFHGPTQGGFAYALLFASIPIGAVVGGVFSGWISRISRQGLAVVAAIVVWGLAMAGFGLVIMVAPWPTTVVLWVAAGLLAIGGAADMVSAAFRTSMLQSAATDEMRGRLQGVFVVVVAGGPRIADVAHGSAAALTGAAAAAAGGGVLVVVLVVLAAVAVPSFVRYRVTRSA
ncbi:MFS transporter [Nocardioides phosphati]|uniref:MFS transporter n=1 Tax=Nocardioides phosphati TaxID=1867775 RepID=A0ABQ2NBT9_9ACTN|nr:MFS transporter [Nocardioides phosphati]GGO90598.1 MFS transporter [Nocardioides phosphati]